MIAMRPIDEEDVIGVLNNERFSGDIDGYVVMNGAEYLGFALYQINDEVTTVLDTDISDNLLVDGIIRACVAAGERQGTDLFDISEENPNLDKWRRVFCKNLSAPYKNEIIFHECK